MNIDKPWRPSARTAFSEENGSQTPVPDLISVCVTNFNYAEYLPACLDSIACQTHRNLDLVIVDDCSTEDESIEVATDWLKKESTRFHRAILLQHERNQGPSEARNTAIRQAAGKHIFIIDSDNEIYPRAIARLYSALTDGAFDAAYCQLEFFGKLSRIGYADIWDTTALYQENYVDVMSLMTKAAWEKVDGFSHIDEGWEDYDFWLKFAEAGLVAAYVPEILCRYRVHENSRTIREAHAAHEHLKLVMNLRHPPPVLQDGLAGGAMGFLTTADDDPSKGSGSAALPTTLTEGQLKEDLEKNLAGRRRTKRRDVRSSTT